MQPVNVLDIEKLAQKELSAEVWNYVAGGAEDELTLADNRSAFAKIKLRPRVLMDVKNRNLRTEVFGASLEVPVILAPTSYSRLVCKDAELGVARAAHTFGTVFVCSTLSHYSVTEVADEVKPETLWFQLYAYESRDFTERLINLAEEAGCSALVITVDASYSGRRERTIRTDFVLPDYVKLGNLTDQHAARTTRKLSRHKGSLIQLSPLPLTWSDIEWVRMRTRLPILIKGILSKEDARQAVNHGVNGVIVSNHGGRQLDGVLASVDALPEVAQELQGHGTVLLDSGIRRGTDVIKALALGASAVLIGRPYLWGLAVDGEQGVLQILDIFRQEVDVNLAQLGCSDVRLLDESWIRRMS